MKLSVSLLAPLLLMVAMVFAPTLQADTESKSPAANSDVKGNDAKKSTNAKEDGAYWEIELGFVIGASRESLDGYNSFEQGNFINDPWFSGGYYNGRFFVESDPGNGKLLTFGYTAIETETLQFNWIATPLFLPINESMQKHGNSFTDLSHRQASFDVGFEAMYSQKFGQLGLRVLQDVASSHGGYTLSVAYSYPVYLNKMVIWPSINLTYLSAKTTDYYYGIRPTEVRSDRPLYLAGSGLQTKFNLYFEYQLTERTSLIGFSHYTFSNDDIYHSPLVSHNTSFAFGVGMIWIF